MKNRKAPLLLILSILVLAGCTKDRNENFQSTTKEFISNGKWSVDYYYSGTDKTPLLSNYQFSFYGNGTVTGGNGNNEFTGVWTVLTDVNYRDVLKITINTQDPHLMELNDQWKVSEKNSTVISMNDENSQLRLRKL